MMEILVEMVSFEAVAEIVSFDVSSCSSPEANVTRAFPAVVRGVLGDFSLGFSSTVGGGWSFCCSRIGCHSISDASELASSISMAPPTARLDTAIEPWLWLGLCCRLSDRVAIPSAPAKFTADGPT
ncbi:hypothetical protein H310_03680 [Aphanomyces invadans]|uniref:Uncharacterized protein n=1 Tax=Aphanomyces invadans TaxID=157072 RepID=A0A024UI18_9STRA|nr:hypothetical protein H310_03680 [Aphanomyces invadans]ETW06086.1 hypothetical protein H310_03680 [Aphanomyces invadans]|eukprot:XP_008865863.1 hypothetical protein H310_03680 [Aphanomyces invadans]